MSHPLTTDVHPLNADLVDASGKVVSSSPLECFFYLLLRDKLPAAEVQSLFLEAMDTTGKDVTYSNGFLMQYAQYLVKTLTK